MACSRWVNTFEGTGDAFDQFSVWRERGCATALSACAQVPSYDYSLLLSFFFVSQGKFQDMKELKERDSSLKEEGRGGALVSGKRHFKKEE